MWWIVHDHINKSALNKHCVKLPRRKVTATQSRFNSHPWVGYQSLIPLVLLTGLQVWCHIWHHFWLGQLLATVPLWGINLRSKVAVFWKALLLLYMTALSVRYLSHTPMSESHLKNESKWYLWLLKSLNLLPFQMTMQHMAIWHSRDSKSRQWHQGVFHSHTK